MLVQRRVELKMLVCTGIERKPVDLRKHAANLVNQCKLAAIRLKVQRRSPVRRLVLSDLTTGTISVYEILVAGGGGKT